jgi:hypothetical protein
MGTPAPDQPLGTHPQQSRPPAPRPDPATERSRSEARDPKLAAVDYFLTQHRTEGKTWLEHGCIIFSQYYDTAYFIGSELAKRLPQEPIGIYAGAGGSGLFQGIDFVATERDRLKKHVSDRLPQLLGNHRHQKTLEPLTVITD